MPRAAKAKLLTSQLSNKMRTSMPRKPPIVQENHDEKVVGPAAKEVEVYKDESYAARSDSNSNSFSMQYEQMRGKLDQ